MSVPIDGKERRKTLRVDVNLPVFFNGTRDNEPKVISRSPCYGRIRNISASGACIEVEILPPYQTAALLSGKLRLNMKFHLASILSWPKTEPISAVATVQWARRAELADNGHAEKLMLGIKFASISQEDTQKLSDFVVSEARMEAAWGGPLWQEEESPVRS